MQLHKHNRVSRVGKDARGIVQVIVRLIGPVTVKGKKRWRPVKGNKSRSLSFDNVKVSEVVDAILERTHETT